MSARCKRGECRFAVFDGRRRLCYRHYREADGFVFDPSQKKFVRVMPQARIEGSGTRQATLFRNVSPEKPPQRDGQASV